MTIKIGVGSCVVGEPVRFNGDKKRRNPFISSLAEHADLVPVCPEVAIGLGVPRKPVRLVKSAGDIRIMDSDTQTLDHTEAMNAYADEQAPLLDGLSGYIGVKGSPSCGLERVKSYTTKGNVAEADGQGIFIQRLRQLNPLLPIEEDGRLNDAILRERFICQVFVYAAWQQWSKQAPDFARLQAFWVRHKYLVMARHYPSYKALGRLLGNHDNLPVKELAAQFIKGLMQALSHSATRRGNTNAMTHIRGYLKNQLSRQQKADIDATIEDYRQGIVPLVVPMRLLQHYFNHQDVPYIDSQVYLSPYPDQLGLRNQI